MTITVDSGQRVMVQVGGLVVVTAGVQDDSTKLSVLILSVLIVFICGILSADTLCTCIFIYVCTYVVGVFTHSILLDNWHRNEWACLYVCLFVCVFVCVCVYSCLHACAYVCVCVCV